MLNRILPLTFLLFLAMLNSCQTPDQPDFQTVALHNGWTLQAAGQDEAISLPARVPGVVQADLIRYGLLPDPFYGANEALAQWVGDQAWEYRLSFVPPTQAPGRRQRLRFEGLDTYAQVWLNDSLIITANNMFRTWTADVTALLRPDTNQLLVRFAPPREILEDRQNGLPYHLTAANDTGDPRLAPYARKAQYQFGWDWGLRLVTCGIWRPVYLESWGEARLEEVRYFQEILTDSLARIRADVYLSDTGAEGYRLVIRDDKTGAILAEQNLAPGQDLAGLHIDIPQPRRWWPNGQGEPYRYTLRCELWQTDKQLLQSRSQQLGLRTVELVQEDDEYGRGFYFRINGRPVFTKGGSYIPQDIMIPRIDPERKRQLLVSAHEANMNLIRIWGGGVYEDDQFYDWCDSLGLLVWQDFMFACAGYPTDPDFLDNVAEEVRQNVRRLRHHPSLLIWCGNNEVYSAWLHWGWQSFLGEQYDTMFAGYDTLFQELLPRIVGEEDPGRPYTHTSPLSNWGGAEGFQSGTMHYWGVWHGPDDFSGYETKVGRYMNEYGFQSFPDLATIAAFADSSQWSLDSPVMAHHQKSYIGNGLIGEFTEKYGDPSDDFAGFIQQSQIVQYEGMRRAILAHRLRYGYCMGTTFWQLDDCWPGPSWSAIDYYGRPKVFFRELADLYAPVITTIAGTVAHPSLAVLSDHPEPVDATLHWQRSSSSAVSDTLARGELVVQITEPGTRLLPVPEGFLPAHTEEVTTVAVVVNGEQWSTMTWKGRYTPMPLDTAALPHYRLLISPGTE
ncbi:MAG: glycoside hydrolase family 2 protein [Lewinella sp.]|nr:glycoside hydrolase family 2 protein [Lewinella sp.]